ncbi:MAG: PAS domain-containing protein [Rhodospirillaceae bacterium]|nr:PAS domain-containing protein [Rhodospirillaceae bacterium]
MRKHNFLRNVLTAIAERSGFKPPVEAAEISANIERAGVAGIGLVNAQGKPITSSPGMPPLSANVQKAIALALKGQPAVIDIYMGASNLPTIGFVIPVYGVQDDQSGAKGIGAVVGLRVVDGDLFKNLVQPGETAETSETYLVRPDTNKGGATIEYLSPLKDGTAPLKRALSADTPDLDVAYAAQKPGGFAIKRDYTGNEVLMVSRPIASVPWVLVRKINRSEAMAETETRLNTLITVFTLIIVGVTVAIFAVWKHGSSLRATQAAENFRRSSERFENLSKFMNLISNSQPTGIVAVDGNTAYTYANEPAAIDAGIPAADMLGKTMASVVGPIKAQVYADINETVLKNFAASDDRVASREQHINVFGDDGDDEDFMVIKSEHIPLRGDSEHPPGVLMIMDDITELTHERRRNEKMLRQLINTLVSVVDRRDPFSSHHSSRVAEVAKAIAEEMATDEITAKTVDISGSLMNLGKIFIPSELLTKTGDLSDDERKTLINSYLVSADLLEDVSFEGPVVQTIREMGETIDGSGPLSLTEEKILPSARILAVANAFVGMVSARAYRDAMTFEKVSDILLSETGTKFDRKSVSALVNFLENRGGKEKWAHYRERPKEE